MWLDKASLGLNLSLPQRPLSCCFDRKGFLAVGLGRGKNIIKNSPWGAFAEEREPKHFHLNDPFFPH